MFVVTFQTKNEDHLYKLHAHLTQNGVVVEQIENRGLCGKNFRFYAPDGNKIDVWNGDNKHSAAFQLNISISYETKINPSITSI
jgi:hypothetical protein